jgi:hypothetical protein
MSRPALRPALAAALIVAAAAVPLALAAPASATVPGVGDPYTLTSTVSPAPLVAADCAADPTCVLAPAPSTAANADDQPAIAAAVTAAAQRSAPATVDSAGTVVAPARQGTVRLAAGTYRIGRPVALPPNVNLRGAGITATTLVLAPESWRTFGYNFMIRPSSADSYNNDTNPGSANLVSDLTVNGSCKVGAGAPDPTILPSLTCDLGAPDNYGGGVKVGNRWTVRQIRFTNLNYFKLWYTSVTGAQAIDNRFDSWGGAGSNENDNIGGGGFVKDGLIEYNQWDETIRGNGIDLTNANHLTIRNNTVHATPFYLAYRGVPDYGSFIMEGVNTSTIANNVLYGSHLVLQSNSRYLHTNYNVNVYNAHDLVVTGNQIIGSFNAGITSNYDDYTPESGHTNDFGGANLIDGNTIVRPAQSGILVYGRLDVDKSRPDTITNNTIVDAGYGGGTYYAGFDTTGIGIGVGNGDTVANNTVVDDQASPTTWYGVQLGQRNAKTTITNTVLSANTGSGVIGGVYHRIATAPEAPTGLSTANGVVTWNESYATTRTLAGYRVYRNGLPVATLAPGSATIPGNVLTPAQSSVESGTAGWTAGSKTTLAWRGTTGGVGNASLAATATALTTISVYGPTVPVTPGGSYTAVASFQGPNRKARVGISWLDANGVSIAKVAATNSLTLDSPTAWVTSTYTTVAPANAVAAQLFLPIDGVAAGETHLIDRMGLSTTAATETWVDPNPAGATSYQVVAFHDGDGENSPVAKVTVG